MYGVLATNGDRYAATKISLSLPCINIIYRSGSLDSEEALRICGAVKGSVA